MRHLLHLAAAALSASLSLGAVLPAQPGTDNVLIIIADDLGVDGVGAYHEGTAPPTPHIDALAARGVLFRNAWSNPTCSPTRACLHTGRHALRTLIGFPIPPTSYTALSPAETTLPEALDRGASGYAHALIGKWHLGVGAFGPWTPNRAGWSYFAGLLEGSADYYLWNRTVNGVTAPSLTYATTAIVDDALSWIARQTRPWVCCVSFTAPHAPFHAPPSHLHTQNLAGLIPEITPRPFFVAMVEAMDNEIGRLLRSLGPTQQRTNVIFLGDNGTLGEVTVPPFLREHGKATPYEGAVNVPIVVAGPAVRSPGREERALVTVTDLFSSVLELAGVDVATAVPPWVELDAVSLVPYLREPGRAPLRRTVFAEAFDEGGWAQVNTTGFALVRDDRFKLIRFFVHSARRDELYDLDADPFEQNDLLATALTGEAQQHYAALGAELDRVRAPAGALHDFGATACAGSAGHPAIGGSGTPRPGQSYTVRLREAPAGAPAVLLCGASATTWGPIALPFDLETIGGGPQCRLYTAGRVSVPVAAGPTGAVQVPVSVQVSPQLVGRTIFHSWLVLDPAAPGNALGVTASNALAVVIGS